MIYDPNPQRPYQPPEMSEQEFEEEVIKALKKREPSQSKLDAIGKDLMKKIKSGEGEAGD